MSLHWRHIHFTVILRPLSNLCCWTYDPRIFANKKTCYYVWQYVAEKKSLFFLSSLVSLRVLQKTCHDVKYKKESENKQICVLRGCQYRVKGFTQKDLDVFLSICCGEKRATLTSQGITAKKICIFARYCQHSLRCSNVCVLQVSSIFNPHQLYHRKLMPWAVTRSSGIGNFSMCWLPNWASVLTRLRLYASRWHVKSAPPCVDCSRRRGSEVVPQLGHWNENPVLSSKLLKRY